MGRIEASFAVENDRRIARILRRRAGPIPARETLLTSPRLEQGAVHGEKLV
jgi:hypothetical protein